MKFLILLISLYVCNVVSLHLEEVQLPPGFSINVFTNSTPKARSLAVSGGNGSIVYISNDLLVSVTGRIEINDYNIPVNLSRIQLISERRWRFLHLGLPYPCRFFLQVYIIQISYNDKRMTRSLAVFTGPGTRTEMEWQT